MCQIKISNEKETKILSAYSLYEANQKVKEFIALGYTLHFVKVLGK